MDTVEITIILQDIETIRLVHLWITLKIVQLSLHIRKEILRLLEVIKKLSKFSKVLEIGLIIVEIIPQEHPIHVSIILIEVQLIACIRLVGGQELGKMRLEVEGKVIFNLF